MGFLSLTKGSIVFHSFLFAEREKRIIFLPKNFSQESFIQNLLAKVLGPTPFLSRVWDWSRAFHVANYLWAKSILIGKATENIHNKSIITLGSPVSPVRGVFLWEGLLRRGLLLEVGEDGEWPGQCICFSISEIPIECFSSDWHLLKECEVRTKSSHVFVNL